LNDEAMKSFNTLIDEMCSPAVLALPVADRRYSIDTDASPRQLGVALFQEDDKGRRKPIGYWSRQLTPPEVNYSATEKECLALVWGITVLRPYLLDAEFDAHTDHYALKWLMTISDPSGRLMGWRLRLSEFRFVVKYKKGKHNAIADMLSRLPTMANAEPKQELELPFFNTEQVVTPVGFGIDFSILDCGDTCSTSENEFNSTTDDEHDWCDVDEWEDHILATQEVLEDNDVPERISIEEIVREQLSDEFCQWARSSMEQDENSLIKEDPDTGVLVRKDNETTRVIVPASLRQRLLRMAHYSPIAGHPGGRKIYATLRRDYYWPSMATDAHTIGRSCSACARTENTHVPWPTY
jgi:hypothetical protein